MGEGREFPAACDRASCPWEEVSSEGLSVPRSPANIFPDNSEIQVGLSLWTTEVEEEREKHKEY